jgi:hypothetical protein
MDRTIKAAAIQMCAEVGNIAANLDKASRIIDEAAARGARMIILPEFFPSAMAFHPALLDAAFEPDGKARELLVSKARRFQAFVGGSYIEERDGSGTTPSCSPCRTDRRPVMTRTCPPCGRTVTTPRAATTASWTPPWGPWAPCCAGSLSASVPCRGSWERWTASWEVVLVVGSHELAVQALWQLHHRKNQGVMAITPLTLSRLLGVAVVHAAHAGEFQGIHASDAGYSL